MVYKMSMIIWNQMIKNIKNNQKRKELQPKKLMKNFNLLMKPYLNNLMMILNPWMMNKNC